MKKTILQIYDNPNTTKQGGIQRVVNSICDLFVLDSDVKILKLGKVTAKYIPIIKKYCYHYKNLERQLLEQEYRYIHIHGFMSILVWQSLKIAKKNNLHIVFSPHYHPFKYLERPFLGRLFFIFFIKNYLKNIIVITINKDDSSFFKKYSDKIIRIPHYINKVQKYSTDQKIKNRILFVGRNEKNKGIEHLLMLDYNKYDIHCVTTGHICSHFKIHTEISEQELQDLYCSSSLVVVPSRYESFSLAALESLAAGTPVLISDRVMISDYLDGIDGVTIFKYKDKNDFVKKIDIAMKKNVDINAIYDIFSKDKVYNLYREIYNILVQ